MSCSTPPLSLLSPKSTGKEATAAAPMSPRGERRRDSLRTRIISRGEHHGEEGGQRREGAGGIDGEGKEGATSGEGAVGEGGACHRWQTVVPARRSVAVARGVIKVSFRYSHVWSWFEDLIITNMMVESKFNFDV